MAEMKESRIDAVMRVFWKVPEGTDLSGIAREAIRYVEREGSPDYLIKLLADFQIDKLHQQLNSSDCAKLAESIRKILGNA